MAKQGYVVKVATYFNIVAVENVVARSVSDAVEYALFNIYKENEKIISIEERGNKIDVVLSAI